MMKNSRLATTALVVALVASLCLPAVAMAAGKPGQGAGKGPGQNRGQVQSQNQGGEGAGQGQENAALKKEQREERKAQILKNRIDRMLLQRQAKFERAKARLLKRIERLEAIASKATSMGVDVTAAKTALGKARDQLDVAAAEELKAQDLFRAVPTATDKRAAFAAARKQARVAQKALQRARLDVVKALQALHKAVDESAVWSKNASETTTP